jgi:N-acetylglutamate synthase
MSAVDLVREVEEVAANAWPAETTVQLDGWLLRHARVTRRACSVWPNRETGALSLDEKIAAAEAFYRERSLPSRFQICGAALPADLDAELVRRGYSKEAWVAVQTALIEDALRREAPIPGEIGFSESLTDEWLGAYCETECVSPADAEGRRAVLGRVDAPVGFATLRSEGVPVAVGQVVLERDWGGLFCIATAPGFRRRGAGSALVGALARYAADRGARRLYLQVDAGNSPAISVYEKFGFSTLYHYWYRERA